MSEDLLRILLVEDDAVDLMAFERFVRDEKLPYDYSVAKSVAEAVKIIASGKFEVILTDLFLGDGTAFEVFPYIRDTPFIVITGSGELADAVRALKTGAYDYLIKDRGFNYLKVLPVTVQNAVRHSRSEKALLEKEHLIANIFKSIFNGIIIVNESSIIESINPAGERLTGYQANEIIGKKIEEALPSFSFIDNDVRVGEHLKEGRIKLIDTGFETVLVRKDGGSMPVQLAISEIWSASGHLFVCVLSDISERRAFERMKDEFVSIVSHELRTPLTSIIGSLGLISGGAAGEVSPNLKEMIDIAHNSSRRLLNLINDILDIQKIEADRMIFSIKPVDLVPLVREAISENEAYAKQYNVALEFNSHPEQAIVNADSERTMQVIDNLVSNAIKFSKVGGVVTAAVSVQDNDFRIAVTDHGPGVPEEFRKRIFQKFAQADASTTRQKKGTGLGLSIAKAIVEKMGGRLGFESDPDIKTIFWFELPAA